MRVYQAILFAIGTLFCHGITWSQQFNTGLSQDNFLDFPAIHTQPAAVSDSRARLSIVSGTGLFNTNNFRARNFNLNLGYFQNQPQAFRIPKVNAFELKANSMDLFAVKYEPTHKSGLGYALRLRRFQQMEGLPTEWVQATADGFLNNPSDTYSLTGFSLKRFEYTEHAFTYGRVLKDDGDVFLKAGVTGKVINGIVAEYLHGLDGGAEFRDSIGDGANFSGAEFDFYRADVGSELYSRNNGFAGSIGFVYEYRPDHKKYTYEMDGEKGLPRYDLNKYQFKFGMSLTDIGRVRYKNRDAVFNFRSDSGSFSGANFYVPASETYEFVEQFILPGADTLSLQDSVFVMGTPAALHVQMDYRVSEKLYVGYNSSVPLKFRNVPNRIHLKSIHTITPRYETSQLCIAAPLSVQANGQFNLGLAARVKVPKLGIVMFAGTNNASFLYGKRRQYTTSLFAGVSYSIFYKIPPDRDNDKVSDEKDMCPDVKGPWELQGCPDTDEDGLIDKFDNCIYEPGPKETRGCPDADGDRIIDMNDQCPDAPGLAIHYGCPDRDYDGIIDLADNCPDIPGIELNNGCPFENRVCCNDGDRDGDGLADSIDACPDQQGSIYNKGCPITQDNLTIIQLDDSKQQLDPNNPIDKLDDIGRAPDDAIMIVTGTEPNEANRGKDEEMNLNIFFDYDDATVLPRYRSVLDQVFPERRIKKNSRDTYVVIGHTDGDGTDNYNLILSKKRAEAVRRELEDMGIDPRKIQVYYYGEWKPIRRNITDFDKQYNRRVEIRVMR